MLAMRKIISITCIVSEFSRIPGIAGNRANRIIRTKSNQSLRSIFLFIRRSPPEKALGPYHNNKKIKCENSDIFKNRRYKKAA